MRDSRCVFDAINVALNERMYPETHIKYIELDKYYNIRLKASLIVEALEEQKAVIKEKISKLKAHVLKIDEYKQMLDDGYSDCGDDDDCDERADYDYDDYDDDYDDDDD